MPGNSEHIDFRNLKKKREEIEQKADRFSEFTSFIIGLLLGAIISVPIQLLLKPLSYQDSALKYGPKVILDPAPVWLIPFSAILFLILVLLIMIVGYFIALGLAGQESVTLPYECNNDDEFFIKVRDYLRNEGEFVNVDVTVKDSHIQCSDQRRAPPATVILAAMNVVLYFIVDFMIKYVYPKTILELRFRQDIDIVDVKYDPNSENAKRLVKRLEEEFGA